MLSVLELVYNKREEPDLSYFINHWQCILLMNVTNWDMQSYQIWIWNSQGSRIGIEIQRKTCTHLHQLEQREKKLKQERREKGEEEEEDEEPWKETDFFFLRIWDNPKRQETEEEADTYGLWSYKNVDFMKNKLKPTKRGKGKIAWGQRK